MTGRMTVAEIKNLDRACPAQWLGVLSDGRDVYCRYRWGRLTIDVGGRRFLEKQLRDDTDEDRTGHHDRLRAELPNLADIIIPSEEVARRVAVEDNLPYSLSGELSYEELKHATREFFDWPESDEPGTEGQPVTDIPREITPRDFGGATPLEMIGVALQVIHQYQCDLREHVHPARPGLCEGTYYRDYVSGLRKYYRDHTGHDA